MDNYHVPHGKGSSFSSWVRLSIPWVRSSSPDGNVGGNAFFHHRQSYFDLFLPKFQKFLTLDIPLRVRLVIHLDLLPSSKILHEFDEGRVGWGMWLLQLFHGFLLVETFDLRALLIFRSEAVFCPLMLSWITPTPASMYAVVILNNGLLNMRGILVSISISRMTKSTGIKKLLIFTRISLAVLSTHLPTTPPFFKKKDHLQVYIIRQNFSQNTVLIQTWPNFMR